METFTDTGEDHILLALGIAIVFVMVYVITWINERKYAADFNEKLKAYQAENAKE